jgi:hypothetical protein
MDAWQGDGGLLLPRGLTLTQSHGRHDGQWKNDDLPAERSRGDGFTRADNVSHDTATVD